MTFINQFLIVFNYFLEIFLKIEFFAFLVFLIIIIHILLHFFRDRKYIRPFSNIIERKKISINDLKELPLVNIIVPAWQEDQMFKDCLLTITKLSYPKINVIVNAGGNEITKNIASEFQEFKNFKILEQKQGVGKVKAIFECLNYVSEGIVYLIDSDVYLNNEIFLKMLYQLINQKEFAIVSNLKPHHLVMNKSLVKYNLINRNPFFRMKFYNFAEMIGPVTAVKYEIFKDIKDGSISKLKDDNRVFGSIIKERGYRIYAMMDEYLESFTYPTTLVSYLNQNIRWMENSFYRKREEKNKAVLLKFLFIFLISLYLFVFPFLFFIHYSIVAVGLLILLNMYLKKIRKVFFFILTEKKMYGYNESEENSTDKQKSMRFNLVFYLDLIFYIFLDALMHIITFLEIVFFKKKYKKRKNLL